MADRPKGKGRRALIAAGAGLALLAAFVRGFRPLSSPHRAVAAKSGTLRVGDQKGVGRVLLEAAGELENVPYQIDWAQFQAGPSLIEAINADALDIAAGGDASTIFALSTGAPIRVIAGIAANPETNAIVVSEKSSVRSLHDLVGKSIATVHGSNGHLLVLAALQHANIPFDAVKMIYLPPADAKAALVGGSVDAWSIWEPFLGTAEQTDHVMIIADGHGLFNAHGFLLTNDRAIAGKRAMLQDYLDRTARAYIWANSHIDEFADLFARETGTPRDVARRYIERMRMRLVPVDDGFVHDEQFVARLYADAKLTNNEVDIARAVDRSFAVGEQAR